jgi:cation diffusion facilitator CzcD-associated flavoprotein CzcO
VDRALIVAARTDVDVLVVGAGPAGLAVGASLRAKGVDVLVVDRGGSTGESWRARYERLHLHTPRVQSSLPGLRIPRSFGRWVAKDDMGEYVGRYARHHKIVPLFGTEVLRLDHDGFSWSARTASGQVTARQVVFATGYSHSPAIPAWPGREGFTGQLLHASQYRSAAPYAGRSALVIGAGNTGAEIAADLAENGAAEVRLSIRTPPNIIPRQLGPMPTTLLAIGMEYSPAWLVDPVNRLLQRTVLGDLSRYGMPSPRAGVVAQARATGITPTIDVGLVAALRAGTVTPVAAVERFDGDAVVLIDGMRVHADTVIAATGYTTGLAPVVGHLGVLDARGHPLVMGRRSLPIVPGLRFIGLSNPLKGQLLQIRLDARAIARAITKELRAR